MAFLSRILRCSHQLRQPLVVSRYLTTGVVGGSERTFSPHFSQPQSLQPTTIQDPWIWQRNDRIQLPVVSKVQLDLPTGLRWVPPILDDDNPAANNSKIRIELPTTVTGEISKQAVRLIVIRRKKMKKHKLKKLRKRMKFEWAKRRQRRELKKEKAFQAVLIKQCKDGEAFSAEKYVEERIAKLNELNQLIESSSNSNLRNRQKPLPSTNSTTS